MLVNLLPGLREIRAPIVSGYLWLTFLYLALREDLPSSAHPGPVLAPLFDVSEDLSAVGVATVTGVAAYLVGSAVQELLKLTGKLASRRRPLYGEAGSRTTNAGRRDVEDAVRIKVQGIRRQLFQVALAPGEKGIDPEPSVETVERELPLIRTLLLGERPQLVGELDRLQAEADLRITVAFPLSFLAVFLAIASSLGWLLLLGPALLLLVQGYQRHLEAGDLLAKALRIGRAGAPSLEALQSSAEAALQRIELEGELRQGMDGGDGLAAFRLGNLQASWDDHEAAIFSLEFACDKGIVRAYAELGLVHERRGDSELAERAYRDGGNRGDEKAQGLLSALLSSQQREEEARESEARAEGLGREPAVPESTREQAPPSRADSRYRRRMEAGDVKAAINLGLLLQRTGKGEGAIEAFRRGTELDPDDPQAWLALGRAQYWQALFLDARAALERALHLQEQALGRDDLELVGTLEMLAFARQASGEYTAARSLAVRALEIVEGSPGQTSRQLIAILNLLSTGADSIGNYLEGRKFLERALAIGERDFGPESPALTITLSNLGHNAWQLEEYERARQLQERTLKLREKAGDEERTAFTRANLASCLEPLGETARAVALFEKAIEQREKAKDGGDFWLAQSLRDYGAALRRDGSALESEKVLRRALALAEGTQGVDPAEVARIMRELAQTLLALDSMEESEEVARRAVDLQRENLRPMHPQLALTLDVLADVLKHKGEAASAATVRTEAHEIRIQAQDEQPPESN